jgi:hypothetical protein
MSDAKGKNRELKSKSTIKRSRSIKKGKQKPER